MCIVFIALSFGEDQFDDHDLSVMCCVSSTFNTLLIRSLDRRKNATLCKIVGNRYRKLNNIAGAWASWRLGAGKHTSFICYDPISVSLCNAFCSYLLPGDVLVRWQGRHTAAIVDASAWNGFGVVLSTHQGARSHPSSCGWFTYSMKDISIASSSPSTVLIPPKTNIIM